MSTKQRYVLRAPRSGRELVAELEPGTAYVDSDTGETYEVVAELTPLAPDPSSLPRTPENLRECTHCGELVGRDLSDCPVCERRLPALNPSGR